MELQRMGHDLAAEQQQKTISPLRITAWWRGLHNSMKLWVMPCRATQDGLVIVKSSDESWSTGQGNGNPLHGQYEKVKRYDTGRWDPRLKNVQYATGEEWRTITKSSSKNEAAGSKQNQCSAVDVSDGECKVWCCKEQYCIGMWKVRSTNQGNMDVFKQEMTRRNTDFFQFSSVTQSCPILCDPMNHSTPGLPVHHQLPEFTQTYIHRVGDAIQPSHLLSSPFPPAPNPFQHESLFQWVNSSHEVAKVLEFQL